MASSHACVLMQRGSPSAHAQHKKILLCTPSDLQTLTQNFAWSNQSSRTQKYSIVRKNRAPNKTKNITNNENTPRAENDVRLATEFDRPMNYYRNYRLKVVTVPQRVHCKCQAWADGSASAVALLECAEWKAESRDGQVLTGWLGSLIHHASPFA